VRCRMHLTIPPGNAVRSFGRLLWICCKTPRKGRFAYLAERLGRQKPRGFDGFAGSESEQPNAWPWSAQHGRGEVQDAPHNPTRDCRSFDRLLWRSLRTRCGGGNEFLFEATRERILTLTVCAPSLRCTGRCGTWHGACMNYCTHIPRARKDPM